MADAKISALPSATYTSGDQFPFVRSGTTSRGSFPFSATATGVATVGATALTLGTDGTTRATITATGDVGIGTASPLSVLQARSNTPIITASQNNTAVTGDMLLGGFNAYSYDTSITSSGGVGGVRVHAHETYNTGSTPSYLSFYTHALTPNNGTLLGNATERMRINFNGVVQPGADNTQTLGFASFRWSEVFAGNGTINTSDAEEKTDIAELDDAELAVAAELKGLVRKYRWKDAVEAKGDDARIHVGVMAQDVAAAFENHGLDPERYGVFCKDELEDGTERLGVRYDQLWAFIIAAL